MAFGTAHLPHRESLLNTFTSKLPPIGTLGPAVALVLACAFFATQSDRFLTSQNFALILQQVMVVAVIAIGQTLIILTAGIDLSCGMIMALGGIVMTKVAADYGLSAPVAIACGIGVTTLFGLLNGLLVTKVKLPPFIVTLGTLNIAFAITQLYSNSQTVTDIPDGMLVLGNTFRIGDTAVVGVRCSCCSSTWWSGWGCEKPRPDAMCMRWATTPRPRVSPASPPTVCCWACMRWRGCSMALPRC
jgi:ribose/xylose/arabinose/galactoside ABC-type transport system permease subunit